MYRVVPSRWQDFVCGKDNAFLIGEQRDLSAPARWRELAMRWIAQDSAFGVTEAAGEEQRRLLAPTRKLRLKLFGKIVKSRCLTHRL